MYASNALRSNKVTRADGRRGCGKPGRVFDQCHKVARDMLKCLQVSLGRASTDKGLLIDGTPV
jgi:hypothetical protein